MSMTGYTKLFSSILASTIWREAKEVKILWITMLAMADRNGKVDGSIPGLADMARLSIAETQTALKALMAPDEFSRSKEFEGRRIETADGGWQILNHGKYRRLMGADDRREYMRVKKRESRDRIKGQTSVNNCPPESIGSKSSIHAEAEAEAGNGPLPPSARPFCSMAQIEALIKSMRSMWSDRFPDWKVPSDALLRTALPNLMPAQLEDFKASFDRYLEKLTNAHTFNPVRFASSWKFYLGE